jgi:pyruvate ferredoxin oxidoreductase gamma subunit
MREGGCARLRFFSVGLLRNTERRGRANSVGVFSVRIHGRGGQGVVTAAELLSAAAFRDGLHAQAFPSFGSERTGAPVVAFCRISDEPIRVREPISEPDGLIVQDPTLLHQVALFEGLSPQAYVVINTAHTLDELGIGELETPSRRERVLAVAATDLAREHLGRPLPNAALLGAFAALTRAVSLASLTDAIRARFAGAPGEGNAAAAEHAYALVEPNVGGLAHA